MGSSKQFNLSFNLRQEAAKFKARGFIGFRSCPKLRGLIGFRSCPKLSLHDITVEDAGEILELFYQRRCCDYFSVDSLELQKIGYMLLRDESSVSIRNADTLPGSVILLPCGWCSLKARLVLSMDDS